MDWLDPAPPAPAPAPPAPVPAQVPVPLRAARPPEWPDLLRLGVHVARSLACVPGRVALWSFRRLAR
jgi:hypothetical protein